MCLHPWTTFGYQLLALFQQPVVLCLWQCGTASAVLLCCHLFPSAPHTSQDDIQHEETTANVRFLFVDCGPLKQMLTAHCQLWKSKLSNLLNNLAAAELKSLHDYFRSVCYDHQWGM